MSWFKIWHQNSNRLAFDPFFGKNCQKLDLFNFRQFLGQEEVQMLLYIHFKARFGISSSLTIFYDPFCYDFHTSNFWPPVLNSKFKVRCVGSKHLFKNNNLHLQIWEGHLRILFAKGSWSNFRPCFWDKNNTYSEGVAGAGAWGAEGTGGQGEPGSRAKPPPPLSDCYKNDTGRQRQPVT